MAGRAHCSLLGLTKRPRGGCAAADRAQGRGRRGGPGAAGRALERDGRVAGIRAGWVA